MRILEINDLEIHLQGDQAFIYSDTESEVLNIENIEYIDDPERLIIDELQLKSRSSLVDRISLFN
ncbi:hypothetical protein [Sulfurimonas sp. C5]|uniref:hypothetical protein n=1 Tax=Sulfurimonas sp. C5 TaxID=3036947 RepID=UPI0024559D57|nr:hypothetical protein [Sulfurimonas sp. C5]MDH4945067.1 hypothetical protein [Sulfurimonas sp. C5]